MTNKQDQTKKLRAVGYCRVSTEEQARDGISLDAQLHKIKLYAELNGLELVEVISDELSAKSLQRPGVQRILSLVSRKQVDAVIITKLDRMFRNTVDALQTASTFDHRGIALHSIGEKLDTHSAMGKFFFTITAGLAEMERNITSERTSAALQYKRTQGERAGNLPFGFQLAPDGVHLEPEPTEQAILETIRNMQSSGKSSALIAAYLNRDGYTTRRGGQWRRQNIDNIIRTASLAA